MVGAQAKTNLPGAAGAGSDAPKISSLNDADAVWSISSTRDVTIHLELDVEDDVDANLREFVRFTRRGDFKRAEQYYRDNLARHSEHPKVVVEYVRMLLEKGAYGAIHELGIDEVGLAEICRHTIPLCRRRTPHSVEALQLLALVHTARALSDPDLDEAEHAADDVLDFLLDLWMVWEQPPSSHAEVGRKRLGWPRIIANQIATG